MCIFHCDNWHSLFSRIIFTLERQVPELQIKERSKKEKKTSGCVLMAVSKNSARRPHCVVYDGLPASILTEEKVDMVLAYVNAQESVTLASSIYATQHPQSRVPARGSFIRTFNRRRSSGSVEPLQLREPAAATVYLPCKKQCIHSIPLSCSSQYIGQSG